MANTYTKIYLQLIFAVKNRQSLITETHRQRIEKYICGIAQTRNCIPFSIYCNPDHTHFLLCIPPQKNIADIVRDIKSFSSHFINENKLTRGHFQWQTGYAAFSYGRSQIEQVCKYIENQTIHHQKKLFRDEYLALLKAFEIEYNEKYVFDWLT